MTTTTAPTAVTVTIPAATFIRDARRHAEAAAFHTELAARAEHVAKEYARHLPAVWRSPGGAPAADVLALIAEDVRNARAATRDAEKAADEAAEHTDDAQKAAWAERDAESHMKAARFDSTSAVRLFTYLPEPA